MDNYLLWSNLGVLIGVSLVVVGFALDILCVIYTFSTWLSGYNKDGIIYPALGIMAACPAFVIYVMIMAFCNELC